MRISDWSSDVCSSDLLAARQFTVLADLEGADVARPLVVVRGAGVGDVEQLLVGREGEAIGLHEVVGGDGEPAALGIEAVDVTGADQIGRASCRESVCKYV